MDFYSMSLTFFKLSDRSACRTFKFLHRHSVLTVQRACKRIIWRPDEVSNGKPVLTSPCVTSAFLFFSNFTVLYQRLATASSTFLRYANLFELLKEKKELFFTTFCKLNLVFHTCYPLQPLILERTRKKPAVFTIWSTLPSRFPFHSLHDVLLEQFNNYYLSATCRSTKWWLLDLF
jgi:hypothetical protein